MFCCCLIVNYGVALHRMCYTIVCRNRHGIFLGLIFGPGIFFSFAGSPTDFFGSCLLAPFDHPRHLKSWVPPWAISMKKAGKSYAEERFLVHKQFEAREEIVVLNYIYHGSIRHLDFLFAQKLKWAKRALTNERDVKLNLTRKYWLEDGMKG